MNPRVGSGMQQAREPLEEQSGEAVRNREVGTNGLSGAQVVEGSAAGTAMSTSAGRQLRLRSVCGVREWTPEVRTTEGRSLNNPAGGARY